MPPVEVVEGALGRAIVVDARPREEFAKSHIKGSLNIPDDELAVRAGIEIPEDRPLALYCGYVSPCFQTAAGFCGHAATRAAKGFSGNISVIEASLDELRQGGVAISSQ